MIGDSLLIGMAWYKREDYSRVLQVMTDRADLHVTYREWLGSAEQAELRLVSEGRSVSRIMLDPDRFLAWCRLRGLDTVAASRTKYVTEMMREAHSQGRGGRSA